MTTNPPWALVADVHCHNWSAFSQVDEAGVNNRLRMICNELTRAGQLVQAAGGNQLIIAGDLFHVRGSVSPSVLVPVMDTIMGLIADGVRVIIVPGNHDLEGKNTERIGDACAALEHSGAMVVHTPTLVGNIVVVPWMDDLDELRKKLSELVGSMRDVGEHDLVLHAPLNGVIKGMPATGLEPSELAALGFYRVFLGHHHNHASFDFGSGRKVYSIGAIAHHTWNDAGTTAGIMVVHPEREEQHRSQCPEFVDITEKLGSIEGNYVRLKTELADPKQLDAARKKLVELGARGTLILSVKKPAQERSGPTASVRAGQSIQQSISDWCTHNVTDVPHAIVATETLRIFNAASVEQ